MTTIMNDLKSDDRSHVLSSMSLIQLEETLVAANLLLDSWRTTTRPEFKRITGNTCFEENPACL